MPLYDEAAQTGRMITPCGRAVKNLLEAGATPFPRIFDLQIGKGLANVATDRDEN
jgi:hypothetical protein